MHTNRGLATILFSHEVLSSSPYPVITHAPLVAGNLPIKKLWLLGNVQQTQVCIHTCAMVYIVQPQIAQSELTWIVELT